ncbi:MAG: TolC family protein, partial [Rhodothermaceae bacterium]|nr:TolC family protein [Rhodothermaceae bacterium]
MFRTLTLALLALTASAVSAQQVISFDEALRLGLERSPDLRLARVNDAAAANNVQSSRADALPLPFISASVTPTQRYGLAFDQTTGELTSETSESLNLGISAQVNLFNGGQDRRALQQARLQRDASTFSLERTRQQVAFDVASRFLQVLLDDEIVRIRAENLEAQRELLNQIQALVDGGVRAEADVFSQRAVVAQAELALLQAEQAVELSKTRLVEALQLDPFGDYAFVAPSIDAADLVEEDVMLDALLRAAYERRTDLQAQERRIAAAQAGIGIARAARLPSLDFSASFGTGYSSLQQQIVAGTGGTVLIPVTTASGEAVVVGGDPFEFPVQTPPELETTPVFTQFGDNRGGSIGLSLSIPIFDRYQTRRQVQIAQIQTDQARIEMDRLRQSIATEVRQAVIEYRNAAKQLDVTAVQVEAAEAALAAEQDRYDLGAGTLVALEQARARLVEAQASRAQATYTFVF